MNKLYLEGRDSMRPLGCPQVFTKSGSSVHSAVCHDTGLADGGEAGVSYQFFRRSALGL